MEVLGLEWIATGAWVEAMGNSSVLHRKISLMTLFCSQDTFKSTLNQTEKPNVSSRMGGKDDQMVNMQFTEELSVAKIKISALL